MKFELTYASGKECDEFIYIDDLAQLMSIAQEDGVLLDVWHQQPAPEDNTYGRITVADDYLE